MTEVIDVRVNTGGADKALDNLRDQLDDVKNKARQANDDGLEKLTKNGGAMAILNDLTGGLAMNFKDAYESVQLTNTGIKGMRAALLATGIGALVVAVGAIAANWEDIVSYVNQANAAAQRNLDIANKIAKASTDSLTAITDSENILRQQGKTEEEILKMKIAATDEVILATELQIKAQEAVRQGQINAAQRNRDILKGIVDFLTIPIQFLLKQVDMVGKVIGEDFGLSEGFEKFTDSFLPDPNQVAAEVDASVAELQKGLTKLKNDRAGMEIALTKSILDEQNRRKAEEERILKEREKNQIDSMQRVSDKQSEAAAKRQAELAAQHESERMLMIRTTDVSNEEIAKRIKANDNEYESWKKNELAKLNMAASVFGALSQLAAVFAEGNSKRARTAFNISKGLALAEATVNTYASAASILKDPTLPTIPKFVAAGTAIAMGLANVAKIAMTKFNASGGGGGGGMSGGGGAIGSAPTAQAPQAALDFSFLQNQQPIQTFVIGEDVKNSNEANQKIQDQSKL